MIQYDQMRARISGPNQTQAMTHITLQVDGTVDIGMTDSLVKKNRSVEEFARSFAGMPDAAALDPPGMGLFAVSPNRGEGL